MVSTQPFRGSGDAGAAKAALRARLLAVRRGLDSAALASATAAIVAHLRCDDEMARASTVAAYVSVGAEPGTRSLMDLLRDRGCRVLLPVLLPDGDLDWTTYDGAGSLLPAARGLLEPSGARLGVGTVAEADVVLVPGLAVSPTGLRLGRGGGSYDRALSRVRPAPLTAALTCVLLHDGESGLDVPAEPHDRAVGAVVTPSEGIVRF